MTSSASTPGEATLPTAHEFDLFFVHAPSDAAFVREELIPLLELPSLRVLFIDELPLGGLVTSEIDHGVSRSRYTIPVLSPAYFENSRATFGEALASCYSMKDQRLIPLLRAECELPVRLDGRIALDFRSRERWKWEAARLCKLLSAPEVSRPSVPYPHPGQHARRRWQLGLTAGALLGLGGLSLWLQDRLSTPPPPPPPLLPGMVRFAAASLRPGVLATGSRPEGCSTLSADEGNVEPDHPASVPEVRVADFDLDRFEVTNGEVAAWLNQHAHLWELAEHGIIRTRSETATPIVRVEQCGDQLTIAPDHRIQVADEMSRWPVTCVSWYGAQEYCRAQGKRLPQDVEWELAAKGAEGRPFPWGAELPRKDGVTFELRTSAEAHPRPVGSSPQDVSPEGAYDLGGNVAEWVDDRHGGAEKQMIRGGSYHSSGPCHLVSSGYARIPPDWHRKDVGFRCARSMINRSRGERIVR